MTTTNTARHTTLTAYPYALAYHPPNAMLLLALLACRPAPTDTEPIVDSGGGCADTPAPALATDAWAKTGDIPASGFLTLATDGGLPIYTGSHSTGMWVTDDDALGWSPVLVEVTHTLAELVLRPGDPQEVFRSSGGALQRTRDGGANWTALAPGLVTPDAVVEPVWAIATTPWAPDRVLIAQRDGSTSLSTDDGDTFTPTGPILIHAPPKADDPFQTWGWRILPEVAEGGRIVFTDGFGVSTSDDAMATWTRRLDVTLGGYSLLRDPADPTHLFVGGPDGLYESTDAGTTWSAPRDIGGDVLLGAWAPDGSWLAFVGTDTVYVSTDAGATFTTHPHDWEMPSALTILDDGRLVMAWHEGVAVSADRGVTWAAAADGLVDKGMSVVVPHPACPARVFAASRCGGGLYRSEDYGATWSHVPQYFHYVMNLVFDPANPDVVWAVSDDKLLRSDDGAATWSQVYQKYHFHGFALDPADPDVLLLGSVGSGEWSDTSMHVYRSADGGTTWADSSTGLPTSAASAHALLRWPGDPDVVLLGTYRGGDVSHQTGIGIGLWRSTDGGASWALTDLPELDIAYLALSGDTAYAATGDGLWRSGDEGVSWAQVAGPEGALLSVGFHGAQGLAFGEDGRAWQSTDAGETWQEQDTELPRNSTTSLAQTNISVDEQIGYATVFDWGVYRIGLGTTAR